MTKRIFFALLHLTGVTRLAAWWNRDRTIFLCYHGVTERPAPSPLDPRGLHVSHRRFEAQLDYLRRHYRVIPFSAYIRSRVEGRALPRYSVVLTFDDGFRNFLTAALPRLEARGMPATVFIITDKAAEEGGPRPHGAWAPDDDSTYLSWAEVESLARRGSVEFGSHTCSHSRLPTLSAEETERELRDSFAAIVSRLGTPVPALSYPKGEYSEVLAEQARAVGYACAVTTDRGENTFDTDLFGLGRTLVGDHDDVPAFAVRVSGLRTGLAGLGAALSRLTPWGRGGSRQALHAAPRMTFEGAPTGTARRDNL